MRIAFTGTQRTTDEENEFIREKMRMLPPETIVITGACGGTNPEYSVDSVVARIACELHLFVLTVVPSKRDKVDPDWQRYCDISIQLSDGAKEPYRERNEELVRQADLVWAFPKYAKNDPRTFRSGTWMTIGITQRAGKHVVIFILDDIERTK